MPYFFISILCALFLNTLLANYLGFDMVTTTAFLPISGLIVWRMATGTLKIFRKRNQDALVIILLASIIFIVKYSLGQNYLKDLLSFLIIPMAISVLFENITQKEKELIVKAVILFYLVLCLLAIYERLNGHSFFYVSEIVTTQKDWQFRSNSLLGHPLANAMAVSTLLSFILVSKFSIQKKGIFLFIGYLALFSFNARGATIIVSALVLPFFYFRLRESILPKYRAYISTIFFLILCLGLYLLSTSNLGGRIFHAEKLLDGSAQSRLNVFEFYNYINSETFWWGNPKSYQYVTNKLGAGGVENGVIVLILKYGIVFTVLILGLLFKFQLTKLRAYPSSEKWFVLCCFYLVGLMNPNLATPIQWTIFIFAYYSFRTDFKSIH